MKLTNAIIFWACLLWGSCQTKQDDHKQERHQGKESTQQILKIDTFKTNTLLGKIDPKKDTSFVKIARIYTKKENIYLKKEAYLAFEKMFFAAQKEDINLNIISAFRSFNDQKRIWSSKWNGKRLVQGINLSKSNLNDEEKALQILIFSSMPGSSRHHWGTDIDLVHLDNAYFESGQGLKTYKWLQDNAHYYGFYQPYTAQDKDRPDGYNEEKWHWSYLPIAQPLLEAYKNQMTNKDIKGFVGSKTAQKIDIIGHYVLGINKQCFIPL